MRANKLALHNLSKMPKDVRYFVNEIDEELQNQGFTLYLSSGAGVKNDCGMCGGYFDSFGKVLAVATNVTVERFVSLLCHESQHWRQFQDKTSVWHDEKINNNHSKFFYWLGGAKHYKTWELVQSALALEKDCEERSLKLIRRRFSHIISPADYCKNANAYLFGYLWIYETGQWFKKPIGQQPILDACSPNLHRKYLTIPKKLRAAFEKCL